MNASLLESITEAHVVKPSEQPRLSIAVRAWNEEKVIRKNLECLFRQSLFAELAGRGERCEVVCIPNGCTDRTADIARHVFAEQQELHPYAHTFSCRVIEIAEAGRNHTWNSYVHGFSSAGAEFLFVMDSDIFFNRSGTLFNMYTALLNHPEATVATDRAVKDICFKQTRSLMDRISLATTNMTGTIRGQLTGQLYCIRSDVARRIYLPHDLGIDDGFLKAVICTDFFAHESDPGRIILADDASHIFGAYTSLGEILNNQKRQMIGQTIVHVLIEYLKSLPCARRRNLAATLRREEQTDPDWLKRLLRAHLERHPHFWQLFPDGLTFRVKRWWQLRGLKRLTHFPAMAAGFGISMIACARAQRHFSRGLVHFWPKVSRDNLEVLEIDSAGVTYQP